MADNTSAVLCWSASARTSVSAPVIRRCLEWQAYLGPVAHSRLLGVLANPSYAGAYVFGRYQSCKQIGSAGEIYTRSRPMPEEQGALSLLITTQAILPGSDSSLI